MKRRTSKKEKEEEKIIKKEGEVKVVKDTDNQAYIIPQSIESIPPKMGIPYGLDWEDLANPAVADFLRSKEIYTYEDLLTHSDLAQEVLFLGQDYYQLLTKAKPNGGNK